MSSYKHPGVYVEEVSTLPPSVAGVSTAIPAFIGYTQAALDEDGNDLTLVPTKISTFLEYEEYFGGAQSMTFEVSATEETNGNGTITSTTINSITQTGTLTRRMHPSVELYFKNGGGPCYIVSVGSYDDSPGLGDDASGLQGGLKTLEKKDEPTILVIPDAVELISNDNISSAGSENDVNTAVADYYSLCQSMLSQCATLGDRFAVLDVPSLNSGYVSDEDNFRNNVGTSDLKYGAAYYPNIESCLTHHYEEGDISITDLSEMQYTQSGCLMVSYSGDASAPAVKIQVGTVGNSLEFEVDVTTDSNAPVLTIRNAKKVADPEEWHTGADIVTAFNAWVTGGQDSEGFSVVVDGDGSAEVAAESTGTALSSASISATLDSIASSNTGLYNSIINDLGDYRITLPPSAAMAGVYARVDRDRGVWKSPANVSLSSVIKPSILISNEEQENLNIDTEGGKSINCIRQFQGKGVMIWGARTLAGNDNEWRYVSVRRLFNVVEESIKKATAFAVFEPNDAATWQKVNSMISSYLYQLWERGALAGSTAETSYFVNVGLGTTMGTQDILEGRMIVEIGIAAVRPAEFIVLRFSHKLQE